jgi:hypothetical protein
MGQTIGWDPGFGNAKAAYLNGTQRMVAPSVVGVGSAEMGLLEEMGAPLMAGRRRRQAAPSCGISVTGVGRPARPRRVQENDSLLRLIALHNQRDPPVVTQDGARPRMSPTMVEGDPGGSVPYHSFDGCHAAHPSETDAGGELCKVDWPRGPAVGQGGVRPRPTARERAERYQRRYARPSL